MMVLLSLGEIAAFAGRQQQSRRALDRALMLARQLGDLINEAAALINLGIVDLIGGHVEDAARQCQSAVIAGNALGSTYLIAGCLDGLAAALSEADSKSAARLFAASDNLRTRGGILRSSAERTFYQPYINGLKHQHTFEEQAVVTEELLSVEAAVAAALAVSNAASTARKGSLQSQAGGGLADH